MNWQLLCGHVVCLSVLTLPQSGDLSGVSFCRVTPEIGSSPPATLNPSLSVLLLNNGNMVLLFMDACSSYLKLFLIF